jgi:MFS family permease
MTKLRWNDYLTLNIYWVGITTAAQTNALIIPLLIQRFVGPQEQGAAYGNLRLVTLMVAVLVQALFGMLSDHSTARWGRRRPYILAGTLANMVCLALIGGATSYAFLFAAAFASQAVSNVAQAAEQGLIPDLVPEERRGRVSGVKALMELLPVVLIALSVGPLIAAGHMWAAIGVAMALLFVTMAATMLVREQPLLGKPTRLDWRPFGRLAAMTGVFTAVILGLGAAVRGLGRLLMGVSSLPVLAILMGLAGLTAMGAAIVIGVWASVALGIGHQEARRRSSFAWWVVNRLAFLVGTTNLGGFAIFFLQTRLGYPGEAAAGPVSRLMMVVGVLILATALPSGWLADRIGRKRLVMLSGLLAGLGSVIILLAPHLSVLYIGGSLIGLGTGMFFTTNWALGTDVVPKEQAGHFLGISNLAGAGAGAIGSYIGGPLADYLTRRAPQVAGAGYMLIYAIYAGLFVVSALVLLRVREGWGSCRASGGAA